MLIPLVDYYVKRKAQKEHWLLPANYRQILSDVVRRYREEGFKIVYSWLWDAVGKVPNASASVPGVILIGKIACMTGCEDQKLIDRFCAHYDSISKTHA